MLIEEVVSKNYKFIRCVAEKLTRNHSEAKDLTQNVLVKIVKYYPKFRGDSLLTTWIYRIVVNSWKNTLRRNMILGYNKHISYDHAIKDVYNIPGIDSVENELEKEEQTILIRKYIDELSLKDKTIILLREIDGKKYEVISKELGIPLGTVKSSLNRAKLRFKKVLKEKGYQI